VSFDLPVDWRVLAFALLLALVVGAISGLLPALRSTRSDVATVLKNESSRIGGRARGRSALVVGQVAFTLVLLVGAGLVVRALSGALSLDPGFRHADVHVAMTDLDMGRLDDAAATRTSYAWTDAVAGAPGVQHVALTSRAPLSAGNSTIGFTTGPVPAVGTVAWQDADWAAVSPSFFDALSIPIIAGRAFTRADDGAAQRVAIVSTAFAQRWFGGPGKALGHTIRTGRTPRDQLLIVGVARDTKVRSPVEAPRMMMYQPLAQTSAHRMMMLVVSDRDDVNRVIRDALHRVNAALPIVTLMSYDDYIGVSLLPQRVAATFATVLGLAGLILASLGIFGVVAYAVTQRHHEIGVRLAIGATPSKVVATVAGSGLRLVALGIGIGLVLSLLAARAMQAFLLGVSPFDALTFVGVVLGVSAVGLAASAIPATRAANVDPVTALRAE
jgi:predicted permease